MHISNKIYTITEYGGFTEGPSFSEFQNLPEKTFTALENFILANNVNKETEAIELLSLSARRGIGKIITARNYVGLITMKDGTVIEILPKIVSGGISIDDTKQIFFEMLKSLKDLTFKDFNISNVQAKKMNLLEIFIKMFIDEVTVLTKQGLKHSYLLTESNERFYKGKLITSENIKHNLINHEKFFLRYEEYSLNRPENRLIKSTLHFLLKLTTHNQNRLNASRLLTFFESVEYSTSYDTDLSKCISDRNMSHYDKALSWCRVFLKGNSFTSFTGSEVALALLFPMEKIFESFITAKIRQNLMNDYSLSSQDSKYCLFDSPSRAFHLRPDIVLEKLNQIIVLDAKWKLLSSNARYSGISQSDMYQMYAYSKKYNAEAIVLIYPRSESINDEELMYSSSDNVKVNVFFVDLQNADYSISILLSRISNRFYC